MTREPLRKLLGAACILLVTLIALEVAVRIWGYSYRHIYDPIYTTFDRTEDIPYIHKPNLAAARARGLAVINTDSLGLRAKVAGASYGLKQPNEYRIAIAGDSYAFGEGIARTEDTFAQVLEDSLNRRQQSMAVKVFNFGASAYSVKEMAATLQYRMLDLQPDLVVMAIISKDFNLSRTPVIDSVGYLIDKKVSFLHDLPVRDGLRGIHLLYVLRDVALSWISSSGHSAAILSSGGIPESYRYIQQFRGMAEQRGLPYLIVLLPIQGANVWGSLPARLRQDVVKYLDLSPLGNEFTREQYMASRFDPHPSAAVHHRIGESLADHVLHQPGFVR
jgi:hypothetical protein